jgi:hypothetical protein
VSDEGKAGHSQRVLRSRFRGFRQPIHSLDVAEGAWGGLPSRYEQGESLMSKTSTPRRAVCSVFSVVMKGVCFDDGYCGQVVDANLEHAQVLLLQRRRVNVPDKILARRSRVILVI